ncbi:MAG: shikimate dehydrogenase [Succinivibrionaceae bacterium]
MQHYFVLGNPIGHSRSPFIHQFFSKACNQDMDYSARLVPLDGFEGVIEELKKSGFSGCNVTVPFKEQAFALSDRLSSRARLAGAVNTLAYDGREVFGDNTDGVGLVRDLQRQGTQITGAKLLIIGAGGAARGIILPLLSERPESLYIVNRTESKAQHLAELFRKETDCRIEAGSFEDVQSSFDLIINASSSSLMGVVPALSRNVYESKPFVYDLMYSPEPTVFMKFAADLGCSVSDGLGMLVEQAAESFFLWRGVRPETEELIQILRREISGK